MNAISDHFELNKPSVFGHTTAIAEAGSTPAAGQQPGSGQVAGQTPLWEQLVLYGGTVVGIIFSSAVKQFSAGQKPNLGITAVTVVLASVIALILMPYAFAQVAGQPRAG